MASPAIRPFRIEAELSDRQTWMHASLCGGIAALAWSAGWVSWPYAVLVLIISFCSFFLILLISKRRWGTSWEHAVYATLLLTAWAVGALSEPAPAWVFCLWAYDGLRYLLITLFRDRIVRYCELGPRPALTA